jgi:hypothetical protein
LTNLRCHRRSAPEAWRCAKAHRSGSKSGSGRWSHWDEIGWVHYPDIGWSHSNEIRWVQSLEILHLTDQLDSESPVQVYYDAGRTYPTIRLHPYTATGVEQAGYVDFEMQLESIPTVLEDFRPFAHREGIQEFYELLRKINGADSQLESCDSAFRPPAPQKGTNSHRALSAYGRLYILFRNLTYNCSDDHYSSTRPV